MVIITFTSPFWKALAILYGCTIAFAFSVFATTRLYIFVLKRPNKAFFKLYFLFFCCLEWFSILFCLAFGSQKLLMNVTYMQNVYADL